MSSQLLLWETPRPPEPQGPFTCPWCHFEEPTFWALQHNHWVNTPFTEIHGLCIAMDLTRNHVIYGARQVSTTDAKTSCSDHRRCPPGCALDGLLAAVARARAVWPPERLDWLPDALLSEGVPLEFIPWITRNTDKEHHQP